MGSLKTVVPAVVMVAILSISSNSVKANGCDSESGNNGVALASLVGFGVLFIYDIPH